jgi:hypothetical protein
MGDTRHKNPPLPGEEEEDVTDDFRLEARSAMSRNRDLNEIHKTRENEPGFLIDSQAALARALTRHLKRDVSDKHISNILGPVRKGSKWDRVDRSTYVRHIRDVLKLPTLVTIAVPEGRAAIVRLFASLPDNVFEDYAKVLGAELQKARDAKKR